MSYFLKFAVLVFISIFSLSTVASEDGGGFLVKEAWDHVEVQARVQHVDMKAREVDLMGPHGNLLTVVVSDEVNRLNEIKVDDMVSVEYVTYMSAEFRTPTEEEEKNPLVVVAGAAKAPANIAPGVEMGAVVKAVVSIEIINLPNMEVTIKGPRGNYVTIPTEDKKMMTEINVGQRLVMIYAEAVALSLEKVK